MTTIKDIAKKAGVSVTTVSRALNDYDDVNIDTKKLIRQLAEAMNYVPNRAARNLVMQASKTLAFMLPCLVKEGGIDNQVYGLLAGMFDFTGQSDYELVLYTAANEQHKKSYLQYCKENNIAGVMIAGIGKEDPYLKELLASSIPCVLINMETAGSNASSVTIDNVQAAYRAVELFVTNNHKHIGMLIDNHKVEGSVKRYEGYKAALEDFQLPFKEDYVIYGDLVEEKASARVNEFLQNNPQVTALFCASDMMAIGAMKVAEELGLKVPEDLSIIGFGDIPIAKYVKPALSTIRQDYYAMGLEAGRQLVRMLKEKEPNNDIYIEYELMIRETVGQL